LRWRLTDSNTMTEPEMLSWFIAAILIVSVYIGGAVSAAGEVFRPDLGMGLTDHLAKIAPPVPTGIGGDLEGRVAVSPIHLDEIRAMLKAEQIWNFWSYVSILVSFYLFGSYILGRQVLRRGWKVGYTRKTLALALYFLPYVAMTGPSPYTQIETASIILGIFVLLLMLMSAPIRNRIPFIATAFASLDRPEDRPFSLYWLVTSTISVWVIIFAWLFWSPETSGYLFVAIFMSGIGDALAEPVGLAIGKHHYQTRAIGTDKIYTRTLEGSAVVFLSGIIAVLLVHGFSFDLREIAALALFPIVGMLAEAKSPHTWDQPFIFASCAIVALGISAF